VDKDLWQRQVPETQRFVKVSLRKCLTRAENPVFVGETMDSFEEETYSTVFTSLRHPIRRKILRALSAGPQSFSDVQRTLGIESPLLTYHLEGLTNLLAKTDHEEYALSSLGRIAVSTMKQIEEPPSTPPPTEFRPRFWRRERARVLALGIICIILGGGLVGVFAYHVSTMNDNNNTVSLLNSRVAVLQNQILSANSTINSLNSETAELENQLAQNNSTIAALQNQLENQLTSNNSTIAVLQNQILSANSTINSLNSETAELENQLAQNNSTAVIYKSIIASLQNQITTLQNQVDALSSKYNTRTSSIPPGGGVGSPPPTPGAPVYFSVEPVAVDPLVNMNASINGLEVPGYPSGVGQIFTVGIHLRNATVTNVPAGVAAVYVDFDFINILNYCMPIGFTTMLGQPGSVLAGANMLYTENGFFDAYGNPVDPANYTQATQYVVVAAANSYYYPNNATWNNDDGLVAQITFLITGQPLRVLNQSDFYGQLRITSAELIDGNHPSKEIPYDVVQGTLKIDDPNTIPEDMKGNFKVNLQDLVLLVDSYCSKPGEAKWNPKADLNGDDVVDISGLVILATHNGS